jgi:hypothetical protein
MRIPRGRRVQEEDICIQYPMSMGLPFPAQGVSLLRSSLPPMARTVEPSDPADIEKVAWPRIKYW